jgi:predicted nicotinamide N-methyase
MNGKNVLELGAGTGLLGIYLSKLGAVVEMTDNNDIVLPLLRNNVTQNTSTAVVERMDWSSDDARIKYGNAKLDYIMGADCVFSLSATKRYCVKDNRSSHFGIFDFTLQFGFVS